MAEQVVIAANEGDCPAQFFTPAGSGGAWPGVIFFMDGLGIRPVLADMAQRIADWGYAVLLPDLFYRMGPYPAHDPRDFFASDEGRAKLAPFFASTDNERAGRDTRFFLDWLADRPEVSGTKVGTTGYCMGGAISLTAAGLYPDRIAAAASFHGGNLAGDSPMSPHHLIPRIKAAVYVGVADDDPYYPPEMHDKLMRLMAEAGVACEAELYAGSLHGWTMKDFPIYDPPAAERHFAALERLYAAHLG